MKLQLLNDIQDNDYFIKSDFFDKPGKFALVCY